MIEKTHLSQKEIDQLLAYTNNNKVKNDQKTCQSNVGLFKDIEPRCTFISNMTQD